ncbi:hypothetical protein HRE53_26065 (plasmid) [Acaryochloris sp. 'Moss Beach']|uniref:hypothetical protein n=1 Tax=Acaryochloris sp. 'Moss Beach' TaxID=2740837 RepID=UPI001F1A9B54|nr:hypothetical protein [Acaryochloris sp. 'Moss Beach']UJB72531.1 hypothetical protein HRE53_26065 [Acaryochloris sp. 'Moss Beach']
MTPTKTFYNGTPHRLSLKSTDEGTEAGSAGLASDFHRTMPQLREADQGDSATERSLGLWGVWVGYLGLSRHTPNFFSQDRQKPILKRVSRLQIFNKLTIRLPG